MHWCMVPGQTPRERRRLSENFASCSDLHDYFVALLYDPLLNITLCMWLVVLATDDED
jgi:hypothetical protein